MKEFNASQAIERAHATFDTEANAILGLKRQTGENFAKAVQCMLHLSGRVVVMGMGKSGHIGRKVAATLASTGTPAMFIHPAEASHGDLGAITSQDAVLAISNSGESMELTTILPIIKRLDVPLVAITAKPNSTLATYADIVLLAQVEHEACPLMLAPTASTAAQMAMGDALAMALLEAKGFQAEDFARSHPGGALGRRLLTLVKDVMRKGADIPMVQTDVTLTVLMREMSKKGVGACTVVDANQQLLGIFTDGDLRRLVESGKDLRALTAQDVMHMHPRTIAPEALAADAAATMEQHQITCVVVVDSAQKVLGIVHVGDLMRAKVI